MCYRKGEFATRRCGDQGGRRVVSREGIKIASKRILPYLIYCLRIYAIGRSAGIKTSYEFKKPSGSTPACRKIARTDPSEISRDIIENTHRLSYFQHYTVCRISAKLTMKPVHEELRAAEELLNVGNKLVALFDQRQSAVLKMLVAIARSGKFSSPSGTNRKTMCYPIRGGFLKEELRRLQPDLPIGYYPELISSRNLCMMHPPMILTSFTLLLPLFLVIAGGALLGKLFSLHEETLIRVVTDFFMPLLIFYSLYTTDIPFADMLPLAGASSFVVFLLLGVGMLYCAIAQADYKSFIPPLIFMNSGFIGIPLMKLWGGMSAMNIDIVYDQVQTIYIFTLGILVVTGGLSFSGLKEMVKSPILWAILLGFACNLAKVPLPGFVKEIFDFGGQAAPPLAAFALGCSLKNMKFRVSPHLIAGILGRTVLGFLAGMLASVIFGFTGTMRSVVIVASSLPSAVFSYVLPARYGVEASLARSMVLASTVLGVFTIPFAFLLAA